MPTERRRVFYSGRVQGVGFRFTARRLAEGAGVTGFVRNLPDGRVELVAEGEATVVTEFLHAVEAELGDKIRSVTSDREAIVDAPFPDFSIRYPD